MAFGFEGFELLEAAGHAGLEHRCGMQRDVRTRGGVGGRGEIVGVGFPLHLEHRDGDRLGQLGLGREPLRCCPAIDHLLGVAVTGGQLEDVVVSVVNQQGAAQAFGRRGGQAVVAVAEQPDQGRHVVAANHRGQQPGGLQRAHQGAAAPAFGHGTEPVGFDIGRFIHTRWNAFAEQMQQRLLLPAGRCFQQFCEGFGLFSVES